MDSKRFTLNKQSLVIGIMLIAAATYCFGYAIGKAFHHMENAGFFNLFNNN